MSWLALALAAALAAAPADKPFVAQGDYWQIRLELPSGWKRCTANAPAPNHGFLLAPRTRACDAATAPVRFQVENNLEDELPDAAALLQQSDCKVQSKVLSVNGQDWSQCVDALGGKTVLHIHACGENPNDAVIFTVQHQGEDAAAAALFGKVLESVQLRCPGATR